MFAKKYFNKAILTLLLALFYFSVASLLTYPLITQFTTHMPGGGEDGPVHIWHLWWFKKAVFNLGQSPLITDWIFYPQKINLVFDVHTFTNALIALPLSYFFNWPTVSNIIVFLSFILSGLGSFYLIKKIWNFNLGALFGSLVFTFSPVVLAQMADGHFNLTTTWFLPFFLIFFLDVVDWRRLKKQFPLAAGCKTRAGAFKSLKMMLRLMLRGKFLNDPILAGFFLGLFALNDYTLSAFALCLSGLIIFYCFFELLLEARKSKFSLLFYSSHFFRIFLVYFVYLIIFSPLWIPALKGYLSGFQPGVDLMTQNVWSADLIAFLMPQIWHPFWNFLVRHLKVSAVESTVFLGWMVIVFATFSFYKWAECLFKLYFNKFPISNFQFPMNFKYQKPNVKKKSRLKNIHYRLLTADCQKLSLWVFLALSFFILSLGPFLHYNTKWQWRIFGKLIPIPLPFVFYHKIPIIGGTQEPARMVIFLMLILGVLCAWALKVLIGSWKKKYQAIFITACTAILFFEYSFGSYPTFDLTAPKVYYQIAQDPADATVMVMPLGWNSGNRSIGKNVLGNLQYYQVIHNKKSFRGTVARLPAENFDFYEKIDGMQFLIQGGGCPKNIEDLRPERIRKILRDFNVGYIIIHLKYKNKGVDLGCLEKVILKDYEKFYYNNSEKVAGYKRKP